jgi:outer membrane protein TolC
LESNLYAFASWDPVPIVVFLFYHFGDQIRPFQYFRPGIPSRENEFNSFGFGVEKGQEIGEKESRLEKRKNEIQEKVNRIIKDVKTAYYELSHVYRTTEVTQRNKKILEDFAKIAETRYAVGEGIQQDVLKAHVEVSKMIDELIMLGQRKRALEAKLNALLNRSPETQSG